MLQEIFKLKAYMIDESNYDNPFYEVEMYTCTEEDFDKFYPLTRS